MHFGFSYVGLIYLAMLFVPNIVWTRHKPEHYAAYAAAENKILLSLERVGEVFVCALVLVFSDYNISGISPWSLFLLASFLLMILYEVFWIRYFRSAQTMADFYGSILGIPVAGATLPVCAFFLLGIYGRNPLLLLATVILGIGHIGIHINHRREIHRNGGHFHE